LLKVLADTFGLPRATRRIEVYDNSHIQGSNAVGCMIVWCEGGFQKNKYRKFNIRSAELTPGDDFGMMREVLERRFKRLMTEAPRAELEAGAAMLGVEPGEFEDTDGDQPWPDLVLIDGGQGQLNAARETLATLGLTDVPMIGVAKGPDRDAGNETFYLADKPAVKLPPRDPLLYFIQ